MRCVLVGQPNSGKSTLFNQVAGYKAHTGNFSGTTVTYTESKVRVAGDVMDLVDLPGTYTLAGSNPAERETLNYLGSHHVDVIVNVIDASHLAQGLELTLELLDLGYPTVVGLNMMDEAARYGMRIDGLKLQELIGTPVLPLIASKGRGVRNLFVTAQRNAERRIIPPRPEYESIIEQAIQDIVQGLDGRRHNLNPQALAVKLIEMDAENLVANLKKMEIDAPDLLERVAGLQNKIRNVRGQDPIWVLSAERHIMAANLVRQVVELGKRQISWRDRLDDLLLHPFWGYLLLVAILLMFFEAIYGVGSAVEQPLLTVFNGVESNLIALIGSETFFAGVISGILQGIAGGVAIVLPYLVPFLLGLGFLEDIGYLPRVAFMMDALMHRIGLHGKAVVPFIIGYGCNVPAVMSTRVLEDRRDRFLASALATLVPCAARLAVVFGLVAFYLGPRVALGIYLFNLLIIAITGKVISTMLPEETPGLILEMPVYRVPTLRTVFQKAWFRAKEFVVEAWPILIIGSVVLALLNYFRFANYLNVLVRPLTWLLGLPGQTGVPLIFGILRKELSLVMLRQALGVTDFSAALTQGQMISFTVFVVFYIPCLATLAVLRRELGYRDTLVIAGLTVMIATIAALAARGFVWFFY